ncbi:hypothetical protein ACI5FR_24480 [Paenibacillus sp. HJGM_3]
MPGPSGVGLLTNYNFIEIPNPMVPTEPGIVAFPLPAAPGTFGDETPISPQFVALSTITPASRIALRATIVWRYTFLSGSSPELTVSSQTMRFSIFRNAPVTGELVGTVTDTGSLTQINLEGTDVTSVNGTFTTTFEVTDTGVPGPNANYFLTGAAGQVSGFGVGMDTGPSPITDFNPPVALEIHFSGEVIGPNVG